MHSEGANLHQIQAEKYIYLCNRGLYCLCNIFEGRRCKRTAEHLHHNTSYVLYIYIYVGHQGKLEGTFPVPDDPLHLLSHRLLFLVRPHPSTRRD